MTIEKNNVKINISGDEYSAYMTITPDPNVKLNLIELGPLLKQHGVVFGIKKDALMNVIDRYRNGKEVENILVAEGIRPYKGIIPTLEYKFERSSLPDTDTDERIEPVASQELPGIINVEKGQLLAVKQKPKQPIDGVTVTGKRTGFQQIEDISLKIGENIGIDEQEDLIYYRAAEDGKLKFENCSLSILPTLNIKEDVDVHVGNVGFKGDVNIGRDVLPNFVVETEGKISILGSAIACKLRAADGVEVKAGIVGKNNCDIYSGTDITAAFLENAKIEAEYNVFIRKGIIGSDVRCSGNLKMEMSRSRIVGSMIQAARGIAAYNVGTRLDTSTRLIVGIHPGRETEYRKIKEHLDSRLNEAREIEKKYGRPVLENKNFSRTVHRKMKEDVAKWHLLKREIKMIHQRLKQTEEAMYDHGVFIRVKEMLYPRVYLQIGRYHFTTTREYFNVTVKCSLEENQLVIR